MFSSAELISFVFANDNDTYYGDDLLKLNLNQYLWRELHESYKSVYFLSAEDDFFAVRTYGDQSCRPFSYRGGFFSKNKQQKFGNWMLQELCSRPGDAAAFVCPLEDFCRIMSDKQWSAELRNIGVAPRRSGTIVLTASATVERTRELLLSSPVFEWLFETAVTDLRGGAQQDLYGVLQSRKTNSCIYLNSFTRKRLRDMLLHVVMRFPDRYRGSTELETMADYLYAWLNDPALQKRAPLLLTNVPTRYLLYRELYGQLCDEQIWNKLERLYGCHDREDTLYRTELRLNAPPVLRDRRSYAGKCVMLQLPRWVCADPCEGEELEAVLKNIHKQVSAPKNRKENPELMAAADKFLQLLGTVWTDDIYSYKLLMRALEFCVCRIYLDPDDKEFEDALKLIDTLEEGFTVTENCFALQRNLDICCKNGSGGPLYEKEISQLRSKVMVFESMRDKYMDLVNASILQLTIPDVSEDFAKLSTQLKEEIEKTEVQRKHQEIVYDDDFSFSPEDYMISLSSL